MFSESTYQRYPHLLQLHGKHIPSPLEHPHIPPKSTPPLSGIVGAMLLVMKYQTC